MGGNNNGEGKKGALQTSTHSDEKGIYCKERLVCRRHCCDFIRIYRSRCIWSEKNKRIKKNPDQLATLIELGPVDQFKQSNDVSSVKFETEIQDAWVTRKVNGTVFVTKDDNGNLLILSPVCTHLGCNVNLTSESEKKTNPELTFYCPCHGGEYNQQGINIGGPPPRPLDIYQPIVQNDKLFINYFEQIQRKKR